VEGRPHACTLHPRAHLGTVEQPTYRELHAAYFHTLPEDRAIAASLAKVHELRKLYGTK
jgi:hypothetical protein